MKHPIQNAFAALQCFKQFAMLSSKKIFFSFLIVGILINQVHAGDFVGGILKSVHVDGLIAQIFDIVCQLPIAGIFATPILKEVGKVIGIVKYHEDLCARHKESTSVPPNEETSEEQQDN
uniref:Uncharacterized protein n=1 Tax=Strigamia maritima TaxID=126957 RepID=T1IT64_STRMM